MDTKELHDVAHAAGLNFKDEDGWNDAISVWTEAIYKDPGYMIELYMDALVDFNDSKDEHIVSRRTRMFERIESAVATLEQVRHANRLRDYSNAAMASSYAYHALQVGEEVILAIKAFIEKYVEDNATEWWGDVCSYDYDMQEGLYADWAYEQWKDRRLDHE